MSKLNKLLANVGISAILLSTIGIIPVMESNGLKAQDTNSNESIETITDDETNLFGQQVTVRGEVDQVEPGVSFVLNEQGFLEGDDVLVLNVSGQRLPEMADEELELQVTGELNRLVLADLQQEYDLDLDPELYLEYEDRPVIFANSITLSPGLEEISEEPENFYGKQVAVEGEVGEIKSNAAFVLNEDDLIGGENLLVIDVTGESIPNQDQTVVVSGMVRPFISAEFERDYDLDWDLELQQQLEAEYSQKPVLVVDSIYPSAEDEGLLE